MNVAILTISTLSLFASVGTLAIMYKTATELRATKIEVEAKVEDVKEKAGRNAQVIRDALTNLEIM